MIAVVWLAAFLLLSPTLANAQVLSEVEQFANVTQYEVRGLGSVVNPWEQIPLEAQSTYSVTMYFKPQNPVSGDPFDVPPPIAHPAGFGATCKFIAHPFTLCPFGPGTCTCTPSPTDSTWGPTTTLSEPYVPQFKQFTTGSRVLRLHYDIPDGYVGVVTVVDEVLKSPILTNPTKARMAAKSRMLSWVAGTAWMLSPGCILLGAPGRGCVVGLATVATGAAVGSYFTWEAALRDPFDDEYMTVVTPTMFARPPPVATQWPAVNAAGNALRDHMAKISGIAEALYHTHNRWSSAVECGMVTPRPTYCPQGVNDATGEALQAARVTQYATSLETEIAKIPLLKVALRDALILAGRPPIFYDAAAMVAARVPSADFMDALATMGLTAEEQANTVRQMQAAPPPASAGSRVLPQDLITQADASAMGFTGTIPPPPAYPVGSPDYTGLSLAWGMQTSMSAWVQGATSRTATMTVRNPADNVAWVAPFEIRAPAGVLFHPCNCSKITVAVAGNVFRSGQTKTFPIAVTLGSVLPTGNRRGGGGYFTFAPIVAAKAP